MILQPNYIKLLQNSILFKKVKEAKNHITHCRLCPHKCGVNRTKEVGVCQGTDGADIIFYSDRGSNNIKHGNKYNV